MPVRMIKAILAIEMALLWVGGCQGVGGGPGGGELSKRGFRPVKVVVHPSFTHIQAKGKKEDKPGKIVAFVSLKDQFGDPLKALGRFRFELFRYQAAMSDPRGQRFAVDGIQEFDLTEVNENQQHWDGTTRNYRFGLKLPGLPAAARRIVVQVTFSIEPDLRLQNFLVLKRQK